MDLKTPKSDLDKYTDKQDRMDESHKKGKESYIKGAKDGKEKD